MSLPFVIPVDAVSNWASQVNKTLLAQKYATLTKANDRFENIGLTVVNWNETASYAPGDLVIVVSGSTATPGTWLCEVAVPDKTMSDYIVANSGSFPSASYGQYIRKENVNYKPHWPEPETKADATADGIGRYWRSLLPYTETILCTDEGEVTYFVAGFVSGSV